MLVVVVGLGFVALLSAGACGGKAASDAAPESGTTTDGGPSPRPAGCPTSDPGDGPSCSTEDVLCEYGDDFDPQCNVVRVCSDGRWATTVGALAGSFPVTCPSGLPAIPANPSDCAAGPTSFPTGTCSSTSSCTYDGAVCTCGVSCPDYPIRQPDCDADAGRTTDCCDETKVAWHCFTGPKYCPTPRPRVGSACSVEGDSCAVSPPQECGQALLNCQSGVWTLQADGCPASSAKVKKDIAYVDDARAEALHEQLMSVRLATYRYKAVDHDPHLGFIIEDMPNGSPAVLPSRERVDLYGYVSMAVASLQVQEQQIRKLQVEVDQLAKENAALRAKR